MMHYMCYRQLNSTQSMHVAQEAYILQPYFAQANCPLVNSLSSCTHEMQHVHNECHIQSQKCNHWWHICLVVPICYEAHQLPSDVPHDIDFPIMCHKCNDQPATCRAKTKLSSRLAILVLPMSMSANQTQAHLRTSLVVDSGVMQVMRMDMMSASDER